MSRLSLRLAAAFLAFVVAGSLAIVFWMASEERRQSREQFAELARTTAEFLKTGAPLTGRTAQSLSKAMGLGVLFLQGSGDTIPLGDSLEGDAARSAGGTPGDVVAIYGYDAVAVPLNGSAKLVLTRGTSSHGWIPSRRAALVISVFWGLSLVLGFTLSRSVVGPLRNLAKQVPFIGNGRIPFLEEEHRKDEIGELARAIQSTSRQLAEERRAREQAERLATLGRMATGLAHEINNPVAAIKLHAQLLESDAPSESIATILGENTKIEALVNQWMFLARPQPPAVAPCDLAELVAECVRTVSPAAVHAKVTIDSKVAQASAELDRRRIAQAVCNVLMNAIHAMADGGELSISSAMEVGKVILVFCDTGPGFSAASLAKATELFYSEKEGGMGIGLSVTAEIVKAHGGELRIANGGHGAVVTLVLPVKAGTIAHSSPGIHL